MRIKFQVSDVCNMHCNNCHWFSEEVIPMSKIKAEDIISFLQREITRGTRIEEVSFSGGEPTLWPDLAKAINGLPKEITEIKIKTNGSGPECLERISRCISLMLSLHDEVNWEKTKRSIEIAEKKKWQINFVGFEGAVEKVEFPAWFKYQINIFPNQIQAGQELLSKIIGKEIICQPRMIYFGTDGRAYFCEKGLRTKSNAYAEDFTLWEGTPRMGMKKCLADCSCASNIINEQEYALAGKLRIFNLLRLQFRPIKRKLARVIKKIKSR